MRHKIARTSLIFMFAPLMAAGSTLHVTANKLTDAISFAEVGEGKKMGEAGWHQMGKAAWEDVSAIRKSAHKPVYEYTRALDFRDSGEYCAHYLSILYQRFKSFTGDPPKLEDLLACYNFGFDSYRRHNFDASTLGNKFHDYVRKVKSKL